MFVSRKVVVSPSWHALLGQHGLDSLENVYACARGEIVVQSRSSEVRRVELADGQQRRTVFIKKYWTNSARQRWSGALRGTFLGRSKVRREFLNLARLRRWGLDAPAPVAYGEERRLRWLVRSFLLSEGVPAPLPLDRFVRDVLPAPKDATARARRRELIERLADYTRRLHEHRFVHHDLFWRNIILSGGSLDRFHLIDAHKGRCWGFGGEMRGRAKDLATLDAPAPWFFTRTERLRFFLQYRGHKRLTAQDKKLVCWCLRVAAPLRANQLQRVQRASPARA